MITLNLIPPTQKNIYKNSRLYQLIKEAVMLIFLFTAIISIMLLLSRYFLEEQLADLAQRNAANIRSNEAVNRRITDINTKIITASGIQKNFQPITPLLVAISQAAGNNIAYSQIKFFRQQTLLELTGQAKTRNDLMELKKRLENSPWAKNVDLPLTNLVSKENNNFIIKINVDFDKLNQLWNIDSINIWLLF